MCGICGKYNKGNAPITENEIIQMRDIMTDRGPDDAGVHLSDHIGLGHRRLSIIDLSEAGRQPLCNEDRQIWLVVNGEIYNYIELRGALVKAGHIFKSKTDSEVIVHGYEEWGEDVFGRLNGMYAIAIWDSVKERLILARDRVGKKPLFYLESNGEVIFASDIKAIARQTSNFEIDKEAIDCYLAHICVPQAHTIFKEIKKVQPAHYMIFDKNRTASFRYWNLSFKTKKEIKEHQYLDEVEDLLKKAVKDRLVSDVPIGAFLSGGVDSSLIVAMMSQISGKKIKTFSVGFDYESHNELSYARRVADRYATEHHELMIKCDCVDILPQLVWNHGEPFADSSAIPSYYISKTAREYMKVGLVGDGGDESFAGYDRTLSVLRATMYEKLISQGMPRSIMLHLLRLMGSQAIDFYLLNRIKFYQDYVTQGVRCNYKNLMGSIRCRSELYSNQFKEELGAHLPSHVYEGFYDQADGDNEVDKALFVDINTILPDDYQVKMDVASMSNSLEVRAPFLDYRLMQFAAQMPVRYKIRLAQSKYLLKKIAEKYIPKENIYRTKCGFSVPLGPWFKKELKPYIYKVVLSEKAQKRGYFNYNYVKFLAEEHFAGRGYHEHKLWSLLWLELWHRMFVDKELQARHSLKDIN
ncbi:MAG: asparagine synthase (glutamine-hydrolyzing) [Patescibacteria group bacterium]